MKNNILTQFVVFNFEYKIINQQTYYPQTDFTSEFDYNKLPEKETKIICFIPPEVDKTINCAFTYELEYFDNLENCMKQLKPVELNKGQKKIEFIYENTDKVIQKSFRLIVFQINLSGMKQKINESDKFIIQLGEC